MDALSLPDGLVTIGFRSFRFCEALTSIIIPDTVTSIGSEAFMGCYSLESIYYQGTTEQWNSISKGSSWVYSTPIETIHCTNGDIICNDYIFD